MGRDVEVQAGDKVVAYVREEKRPPAVIYEDENVLAADKPKGVESEAFFKR